MRPSSFARVMEGVGSCVVAGTAYPLGDGTIRSPLKDVLLVVSLVGDGDDPLVKLCCNLRDLVHRAITGKEWPDT